MNEFTKEELNLLNNALCVYLEGASPIEVEHLQDKVQSLIDNYCEHEHKQYSIGDSRPMIMTHECLKCGKDFTNE